MYTTMKHKRISAMLVIAAVISGAAAADKDTGFRAPRSGGDIVSLPSVEAAPLCRHTEHSVNHSTGQASITMPLYTLNCGNMSLPISISYSTGGVKVDDEDGPVGASWDLQCGGMVSRRIIGRPDGINGEVNIPSGAPTVEYLTALDHYAADSDYDRYNYLAGSYSGTFIIKNGNIVQLPETDVTIRTTADGSFRIITPDGTEYVYDVVETVSYQFRPMALDYKQYNPDYTDIPCQWRLGRIINPSRTDSIMFEYADMASRQRQPASKVSSISANDRNAGQVSISHHTDRDGVNSHIYTYNNRHGLSRIKSRAGTISFTDATLEPIKGFTVNTPDGKEVRRVAFEYQKYDSKTKKGISLLQKVTISADGENIDGATFKYYEDNVWYMGSRDIFGYNNHKGGIPPQTESILEVEIPKEQTEGDSIVKIRPEDIIPPGGLIETPEPSDTTPRYAHIVISEQRKPNFKALQYKSLKSFTTYAGATTEFTYEMNEAAQKFKFDGIEYAIAPGIRIKSERTTDHNTGNIRVKEYTYSGGVSTIDFSKIGYSSFIGMSGSRGVVQSGAAISTQTYCTTNAVLTTTSLMPGDVMEDATVYYGHVREKVTGTGIDCPIVTDYVFDTTNAPSPYIMAGKQVMPETPPNDKRYCGKGITIFANSYFVVAYSKLLSPQLIGGYFRQTFREKAPLTQKTEWVTDSCGTLLSPLRVTDYIYTSGNEKLHTTGYYSTPLVRTIESPFLGATGEDYKSTDDFNYFPVTVATCKTWCDSVRTTEYDRYGNSRTVVTAYEYNDRPSQSNPPKNMGNIFEIDSTRIVLPGGITSITGRYSLISRISKSCGGDVYSTDYEYSCNAPRGLLAQATAKGRISMPVRETYRHGAFMLEKRYNYTDFGAGAGNLQLSSTVCAAQGTILTDSISIKRYDRYGNPLESTDFSGHNSRFTWGGNGTHLQQVTRDGLLTTKYEYSPLVGYTRIETPSGTANVYGYSAGRLVSQSVAGENTATYAYSQYGTDSLNKIEASRTGANGRAINAISRYDAFGNRILSGISGGGGKAIVNVEAYDILGRKLREYLPADCDNPDGNISSIANSVAMAYDGDTEALRRYGYMPGNDGRVRTVTIGGEEFAGHPVRSDYRFNAGADGDALYRCRKYRVEGNALVCDGYYDKGTLAIKEATDGDGRKALTFTDFSGKVILSRAVTDGVSADTYSIYNDGGDLTLVLPPMASSKLTAEGKRYDISSDETLLGYADHYRYDDRLLLAERRMAGTEPIVYRHDAAGRLVLTQDGEQRARGVTGFVIQDYYGRPSLEGEALATSQLMDGVRNLRPYALRSQTLSGRHAGYGVSLSMSNAVIDKAYYYDDYGFLSESCCAGLDSVLSVKPLTVKRSNNRGLLTGSLTRINSAADFDGSVIVSGASGNYIAEAFGYDSRERVAESISVDPQGVAVRENSTYSSSGLPLTTNTVRRAPDGDIEELGFVYTYDDFDRQTSVTTSVNGVEMAVSATSYDAVGRTAAVTMRDMRSETGQTIGYSYITNGAVKSIATSSGSMAMTLHYASGAAPSYSGNISGMEWKGADKVQRSYTYSYDGLNRLVAAQYAESGRQNLSYIIHLSSPDYSCSYEYDINGNPLSIIRKGLRVSSGPGTGSMRVKYEDVDRLTFGYLGNRVTKVSDTALRSAYTGAADFEDKADADVEYEYDSNGNMTVDSNRGIANVVYNNLNLPVRVEMGDGSRIENMYDADGGLRKRILRQTAGSGSASTGGAFPSDSIDAEGYYSFVTDYCGPWEYVDGRLNRISIPGGYIEDNKVLFNITDHQGNIRQIWNVSSGITAQDSHYYPYGGLFGESASTEYVKAMTRTGNTEISANPYRYSGKEWQTFRGLNQYDFTGRQYDPTLCRFTSPDPLNGDYPYLSPYLYCAANPINMSDPTGLNPVYDWDGNYLGNSKEGFTGEILIYTGNDKIDFSKYYAWELKQQFRVTGFGESAEYLSIGTKLAIFNHIVAYFNGTYIFRERFDLSRMDGRRIQLLEHPDQSIHWATAFKYDNGEIIDPPKIYWGNNFTLNYEATVENIVSSVLVHEWYSHGIMHIERDEIYHKQAYLNVCNSPFWNKTSEKYKKFVLNNLLKMLSFGQNDSIFYNNLVDNLFELITKMYAK